MSAPAPGSGRRSRALAGLVLGATLVGACAWRLACVHVGPDPDTDAYSVEDPAA